MNKRHKLCPIWLMQPIPYFGEKIKKSDWIIEPKIDGWRMQIICNKGGRIEFWGRRLEKKPDWTKKLKYLAAILEHILEPNTLIDSELYAEGGRRFIPSVLAKKKKLKPIIYAFDIIYYKGKFIGNLPLLKRKTFLKKIQWPEPFYFLQGKSFKSLKNELSLALKKGFEGVIIKKKNSKYLVGNKYPESTEYWRKIKG